MIERYSLTSLDDLAEQLGAAPPAGPPRYNIAPLQLAPLRTADGIVAARWGLLPPWRGHGGKRGPHILHAPLDALEATPVLRNAFQRQRCLVLADGLFAWHRSAKKSQPLWLHPAPARPDARSCAIAFAGIAATHRDDHQLSFALLVAPAGPVLAPFETTSPLVLPADAHATWLTGPRDRAAALLADPAALTALAGWRAEPVSTWVNATDHDDPRCIEPLGNPAQGELF